MKNPFWRSYFPVIFIINFVCLLYYDDIIDRFFPPPTPSLPLTLLKDYATIHEGSRIINSSETYFKPAKVLYFMSVPLYYLPSQKAEILLQRSSLTSEQECWLAKRDNAFVEIQLPKEIEVLSIEYHHFYQDVGKFSDATPRIIEIYAHNNDSSMHLGKLEFGEAETAKKTFENPLLVSSIKFYVAENYGNPDYSALCQISVYGNETRFP